jgi:PAS domain S-box-containing protein
MTDAAADGPDPQWHPLLRRQLRKAGSAAPAPGGEHDAWMKLLSHLNAAYVQADEERYTLQRTVATCSREMEDLNKSLKASAVLLALERDRLDGILGALRDVVWSTSADQATLLYVNSSFHTVYGRLEAELFADPWLWLALVHPEDRESVRDAFAGIRGMAFLEAEYRVNRPDGEIRWLRHLMQVIRDVGGTPIRVDTICSDVTEKKLAELEIIKARDAAEASARIKSQFLANVSHEVRTPLNGILGMLQLLLVSPLPAKQKQMAQMALDSSWLLVSIIDDILDMSKIEAGKFGLREGPFDVRRTVEDAVSLLRPKATSKGLRLGLTLFGTFPEQVRGDSVRLRQVLLNLLGNGIKFTEKGEVIVEAEITEEGPDFAVLRCELRDTGVGIDPEAGRALFQPFSQADGSTTRKYGGSGLGLFIARQLVELMGGSIGYESTPGTGSRFWFTVRLGKTSAAAASAVALEAPPEERGPGLPGLAPGVAPRILIVEDNLVNQHVFHGMLEKLGFQADLAANGVEALASMAAVHYGIVFMDCQMPVLDGYETTRRVRGAGEQPRCVIIALTAHAMPTDREKCLQAGMDDYVAKPVSLAKLGEVLTKWISTSQTPTP